MTFLQCALCRAMSHRQYCQFLNRARRTLKMTTLTSDNHIYIPSLPHVAVDHISGFLEVLSDEGGRERLAILANHLSLPTDDLLLIVEAGNLLGFVQVDDSDVV